MSSGVRSYFCVWNNPEEIIVGDERLPSELSGLEPQDICDTVLDMWVSSRPKRYGWVGYCISSKGLHHLHMVLESKNTIEFSSVKKVFPRAHLSITMGNKKQIEDYINKRGKFEEKGEIVVCHSSVGELKGNQGKRSDLLAIEEELALGKTPSEIIGTSVKRQRYSSMIHNAYMKKREEETDIYREVKVFWHWGASGTGKSFEYVKLCETYGRGAIYKVVRDLSRGRFDLYEGEKILFLDELKPFSTDWIDLLNALDNYLYHPSARYHDTVSLWEEVHITSVYSPRCFYEELIPIQNRKIDTFEQLERRIDTVVYHSKDATGYHVSYGKLGEYLDTEEVIKDAKMLPFK